MKRANLLLTDQSSSGSKMATTGLSTPSGSTRTKAAKGLFSHFMFLASLLLISLLTSGKVLATEYTVTLADAENCGLSVSPGTTDGNTKEFTLTVTDGTNTKLPDELESVVIGTNEGLTANDGTSGYTYSNGTLTIGSGVTIDGNIVIIASAKPKSNDASLKSLTYSIASMSITDQAIELQSETYTYTVELNQFVANATAISLTPTVTATGLANVTANLGVASYSGLTGDATITVTAENGTTQDYTITFTSKDKLKTVETITVAQLTERYADASSVITALGASNENATVTSEKSTVTTLPVTWSYSEADNGSSLYNAAVEATNNFRWTLNDLGELLNPDNVAVTGTVSVQNTAASDKTVISSLTYKIGEEGQSTAVTGDLSGIGDQTYAVELPYGTAAGASITVNIACNDNATAKLAGEEAATEFPLTLSESKASLALIITAENGSTTRNVTINFTTAKELVTVVAGVPKTYTLPKVVADENAAIALLDAMDMKTITLTANSGAPLKLKWAYSGDEFNKASGQSNNFTWTVVKEDGSEIAADQEVTVTGTTAVTNYTVSAEAGISTLTYQVAGGSIETIAPVKEASETNDVTVAYGTKSITVSITPTDSKATVSLTEQPNEHGTLVEGVTSYETPVLEAFKFTITAEDGTTAKNFIIKFIVDKEKITAVTVPATYKLTEAAKDEAAAIALLADMDGVVIKTNGVIPTKLSWTYEKSKNNSKDYSSEGGKTNVFSWSAVRDGEGDALEAATGVTIQGTTTVTNFMPAVTGDQSTTDVQITNDNPVDKIGDGQTTTTVKSVEIAAGVTTEQLTISKAEIKEKLDLKGSVGEIVLNETMIPEITLATGKTTTLTLQSGNEITKITNEGTLVLQDAAIAPRTLAIETRAALANKGAVGTVVNNGVFTDKTATIVTVEGNADLTITTLPKDQSTTGKSITLNVVAETTNGAITYKWQKYTTQWIETNGTDASLKIDKTQDGSIKYRCEVKSTKNAATTTLYTPAVTVTFRTEGTPSEPSNPSTPTYTVSLDKVAGATFSKGETTTVDEGDNFSFKITLDKDYDQSKPVVTVDGKAITADADGNYTIKNIQKDIKIIVSGIVKNTATGIEENVADAARAWTVGSTLYIHVPETSDVYIISGTGALQQQLRGVSGDYNMQLRAGFYIVRIGNVSQKVIIR